jgi:hypothetical protein
MRKIATPKRTKHSHPIVFVGIGGNINDNSYTKTMFQEGIAYEEVGLFPTVNTDTGKRRIGFFNPAYLVTVNNTKEDQEIFKAAFKAACDERKSKNKKGGTFYS